MPWRAHASTASHKFHCSRTVARLIDRREISMIGLTAAAFSSGDALSKTVRRKQFLHATGGQIGIMQYPRFVGQAEQLGEVQQGARALLPADHDEMVLQPV